MFKVKSGCVRIFTISTLAQRYVLEPIATLAWFIFNVGFKREPRTGTIIGIVMAENLAGGFKRKIPFV
jgi:hypothetical protein